MKKILTIALTISLQLGCNLFSTAQNRVQISIEGAIEQLDNSSRTIEIAQKGIEIAKGEKARLNSTWYPNISAAGTYMNMSEKIEVSESLEELAQPILEVIPQLEQILSLLGPSSLTFPLLDNNVATIDGTIAWPLFTGGKRIYANKIGKSLVNAATLQKEAIQNAQHILLIERYYTAKLLEQTIDVCREEAFANKLLYENAEKMLENGIINNAGMLVAKVAYEESELKFESAVRNHKVAEKSLLSMLEIDTLTNSGATLSTPFFICTAMPSLNHFITLALENNQQTKIIGQQKDMATNSKKIARSGYLPDISIFARQNIYSYNIPSNLLPRRMVGAAFAWNIFDGLNREKRIQTAHLQEESLQLGLMEAQTEITRTVRELYTIMEDAQESLMTIETSISLTEELVDIRKKSFNEGMATTQEVVDANALLAKSNLALTLACYKYEIALANLLALCGNTSEFVQYTQMAGNIFK